MSNIEEQVKKIVAEQLGVKEEGIKLRDRMRKGWQLINRVKRSR